MPIKLLPPSHTAEQARDRADTAPPVGYETPPPPPVKARAQAIDATVTKIKREKNQLILLLLLPGVVGGPDAERPSKLGTPAVPEEDALATLSGTLLSLGLSAWLEALRALCSPP
jgi:hypothetical protein